jgi:sulfur-oxidizing protein SoxY
MNRQRRIFLRLITVGGATLVALGTGLITPQQAWAAWPKQAFDAENLDAALKALFEGASAEESEAINLKAPDIAENGAVVPVSVQTDLPNVESISILVENNPSPLAASFELTPEAIADVSTRLKMSETSNVIAMVKSEGKLFMTKKEVKVTIGGCGG